MKILKLIIPVLLCLVLCPSLYAQTPDTISTDDIVFSDVTDTIIDSANVTVAETKNGSEGISQVESTLKSSATKVSAPGQSIWQILLEGFLSGLAAVLMPCIFPMLPLTVSFFTKSSSSRSSAIGKALIYGLSIIVIYVVLGLLVTVIFGSDALNNLSTNGIFNFLFFILLIVFAVSFLGAFEITLPSKWVNAVDSKADTKGFGGLFFMAGTLALVSFSCTGPIIGTLLVRAATMGELLGPAAGMLGFSTALAIPFALFALFPSWLKSLPKSGGWLNSVKVVLGFLELALALKFLSNVDLAYHWNLLDREVFLALWIVIFGLLGLYLLGKVKFAHDSPVTSIPLPRFFLAVITLTFTIYMIPGLWGAPLKAISAFLPPQHTQDFDLFTAGLGASSASKHSAVPHKYSDKFDAPLGLDAFFDYEEGLAYAKSVNKPVMIDFTGHACVNCRKMEASVWSDKKILETIREKYVLIQLYVDDKTELPKEEQTVSAFKKKKIRTIGNKWSDFQASRFNSNSQPFYVLLSNNGELLVQPTGAEFDTEKYLKFLESGLAAFK
ncbi:protein-disulfide reductase DsbD family protein [Desertivirga brevis]|uniref:protein-disulfide reductase DsbD family protein n=1 Tax=Desertivirga brevis TaxID=2810310 RepID=UPI001A962573|nr:cytochrome c biogenesis protein CcdA [Pedobacter sp. SYSU D00873]